MDPHLIEGYYVLRRESGGLRKHCHHFEGLPWMNDVGGPVRVSRDGWKLQVYDFEGSVGATVYEPDGTFSTYS